MVIVIDIWPNLQKKLKLNAEQVAPDIEEDESVLMDDIIHEEANPSPNLPFTFNTFFVWAQQLHDKEIVLPSIGELTKATLPHILFTKDDFERLEANRASEAYSWAREAYDSTIGVDPNEVLSAEEAERYAVYVSVLRMEKLQEVKRMFNIDFADLVSIFGSDKRFNMEVKDQLD